MSKVIDIIRDALSGLRVLDAREAPEAEDMADAMRVLNLMMARWETSGIAVGWSPVSNSNDDMPVPPEAEECIGAQLALRLAPRYGMQPDSALIQLAADGLNQLFGDMAYQDSFRLEYDLPTGENNLPTGQLGYFL